MMKTCFLITFFIYLLPNGPPASCEFCSSFRHPISTSSMLFILRYIKNDDNIPNSYRNITLLSINTNKIKAITEFRMSEHRGAVDT